jgi:hypothetical protein
MADEPKNPSETVPGGAYIVAGRWVDAWGQPVEDPTPKAKPEPKPDAPKADDKPAATGKKEA